LPSEPRSCLEKKLRVPCDDSNSLNTRAFARLRAISNCESEMFLVACICEIKRSTSLFTDPSSPIATTPNNPESE